MIGNAQRDLRSASPQDEARHRGVVNSPISRGLPALVAAIALFAPQPALAYIGPGAGLSALGAFLALVLGILVALFGFLWYPVKRIMQRRKAQSRIEDARS